MARPSQFQPDQFTATRILTAYQTFRDPDPSRHFRWPLASLNMDKPPSTFLRTLVSGQWLNDTAVEIGLELIKRLHPTACARSVTDLTWVDKYLKTGRVKTSLVRGIGLGLFVLLIVALQVHNIDAEWIVFPQGQAHHFRGPNLPWRSVAGRPAA